MLDRITLIDFEVKYTSRQLEFCVTFVYDQTIASGVTKQENSVLILGTFMTVELWMRKLYKKLN